MTTSGPQSSDVDKEELYGRYYTMEDEKLRHTKKQNRLVEKLAHKSVDIPEEDCDDVRIEANKTYQGIGAKGLMGVAAIAGLPSVLALGLVAYSLLKPQPSIPTPPNVPPTTDTDTQYELGTKPGGSLPWPLN